MPLTSKICSKCKEEKSISLFSKNQNNCKECTIQNNRVIRERNQAVLEALKLESGCVDCGYNKDPVALDFDHLPEYEKKFNLSGSTRSLKVLMEEASKCEVVCANCHRIRTRDRGWQNQYDKE